MTVRVLTLTVEGQAKVVPFEVSLRALQEFVGGYVEPLYLGDEAVMYLNEDGKFTGLAMNTNANRLVYLANPGLMESDYIVGNVMVMGLRSPDGTVDGGEHDVPQSVLDMCRTAQIPVQESTDPLV